MNRIAERIKECLPLQTAVIYYTGQEPSRGKIKCPFHNEKTASFTIFPNNKYYCFGCGASGDVISFTEKLFGINFGQAAVRLNNDFGLMLPIGRRADNKTAEETRNRILEKIRDKSEQRRRADEGYWNAFDYLLWLENNRLCCMPTSPDEIPSPLFLESLGKLQYAKYTLNHLEDVRRTVPDGKRYDGSGV